MRERPATQAHFYSLLMSDPLTFTGESEPCGRAPNQGVGSMPLPL